MTKIIKVPGAKSRSVTALIPSDVDKDVLLAKTRTERGRMMGDLDATLGMILGAAITGLRKTGSTEGDIRTITETALGSYAAWHAGQPASADGENGQDDTPDNGEHGTTTRAVNGRHWSSMSDQGTRGMTTRGQVSG